jgi:hypothetical protein
MASKVARTKAKTRAKKPANASAKKVVCMPSGDRDAAMFATKAAKKIPFDFVLDELEPLAPHTKPMFGCTAVYVGETIVFILRDKNGGGVDDGVWIATTAEHHESLRKELRSMRSITVFGSGVTGWQVLPSKAPKFEDEVLRACAIVRARDPRIGKIPKRKAPRRPR